MIPDKKLPRKRVDRSYSCPAPVKGLNTLNPPSMMDPVSAVTLSNFVATPQGVAVRKGTRKFVTGLPTQVESLMAYRAVSAGTDKLFAASGTAFYDVTNPGTVGAAVVSSLTNAQWEHINFAGAAGQFLVCVNGFDAARHYDGTSWTTWTQVTTPASPGQVSGVNPNVFSQVISHQRRLWFVEKNSSKAWYTPVNSIGGAMNSFDFGPLFPRGGKLRALGSWSVNAAVGMQSRLVAVSEAGDVVIYDGTDVSDSTKWQLAGTWRSAAPIGKKCLLNFGGELLYLSQDGLVPMSTYLQTTNTTPAISNNIQPTISNLTFLQGSLFGWQVQDYLPENILLVNVPQINPANNIQLVSNTITGGWSVFTGWGANCWQTLGDKIYFGGNGIVYLAFQAYKDNALYDGTGGDIYTATAQSAFNYFDVENRARLKHMKMARINMVSATTNPTIALGCNMDFNLGLPDSVTATSSNNVATWNTGIWDSSVWTDTLANINDWQSISGVGYCASIGVSIAVQTETIWVSTDLAYEPGGLIG